MKSPQKRQLDQRLSVAHQRSVVRLDRDNIVCAIIWSHPVLQEEYQVIPALHVCFCVYVDDERVSRFPALRWCDPC